jgi:hypothetical protein
VVDCARLSQYQRETTFDPAAIVGGLFSTWNSPKALPALHGWHNKTISKGDLPEIEGREQE